MTIPTRGPAAPLRVLHARRRPALVLVAHGSRDPGTRVEVRRLADRLAAARPELDIRVAHLGLNAPLLSEVLDGLSGPAVLVPLLLSRGYHVKVDLPALLAAAPQVSGRVAPPLGPDPLLTQLLHTRLTEAGWGPDGDAVVLAAAGSRDPEAAEDTETQAALLAARLGVPVRTGTVTGGRSVAEAVARLTAEGHRRVAVASYFTAPGDFARLAASAGDWVTAAPLGAHPTMVDLILTRYRSTSLAGARGAVTPTSGASDRRERSGTVR